MSETKILEELTDEENEQIKDVIYKIALKRFDSGINEHLIRGLIHSAVGVSIYEAYVCSSLGE